MSIRDSGIPVSSAPSYSSASRFSLATR